MKKKGTNMVLTDCAGAGDIISIAGLSSPSIGHTVATVEVFNFSVYTYGLVPSFLWTLMSPIHFLF